MLSRERREGERIDTSSVFALGLVAQYAAIAMRNVELYGELDARRNAVVELNQVKDDLIAMLAHDFKGPLTSIVGFAQILAEDPNLDAQSRHWLDTITQNALRLANLATDTLALSRLENADFSLVRHPVDVAQLVRACRRSAPAAAHHPDQAVTDPRRSVPTATSSACIRSSTT